MFIVKITFIILVVLFALWSLVTYLTIWGLEEPKYIVVEKRSGYEVRSYDPYIVAEAAVGGEYRVALSEGFRHVAGYIFGNNISKQKIAMTMPVSDTPHQSEKIAMTIPVLDRESSVSRTVAFVLPSEYTIETLPTPTSERVILREVPGMKYAVRRFTWWPSEARIEQHTQTLLAKLEQDGYQVAGSATTAYYNTPWSAPFLLRNEILIPIE